MDLHDMMALPSILIYGRDPSLLDTRRWVLERAGYRVLTAQNLAETEHSVATEPISLFLLCHSLSPQDCEVAFARADKIQPEMKRLLITANTPVCAHRDQDRLLSAFDGPKALVATVHEMAPQPAEPS
jgi:DNA-binding NtrC family response regulator